MKKNKRWRLLLHCVVDYRESKVELVGKIPVGVDKIKAYASLTCSGVGVGKLIMKGLCPVSPFSSLHAKSCVCFKHQYSLSLYIHVWLTNHLHLFYIDRVRKGKEEELEEVMGDGRVGKG